MAKRFFIIIILVFPITISFADTHIPEGDVSGIWTFPNSPYIIDGEINIPVDSTLVIEPGIQVIFSEHYKFNIYGRLLAEGTLSDTIIFTIDDTTGFSNFYSNDGGWHSLRFYNTNTNGQDSSKVVYCILEYGKATGYYPDDQGGAIYLCNSSNILIKNCLITTNIANCDGGGIYCSNSSPIIANNIISYNTGDPGGGISCGNDSNPIISNNVIKYNIACSSCETNIGAGISCFYSSPTITDNIISNNYIPDYGHGGGINCEHSSATINNNIISNNVISWGYGGGINCDDSNLSLCNVTLLENIADYGGGIYCDYNSNPSLSNVTISGNNAECGGGIYFNYNSIPNFDPLNRCNIFLNFAISGNELYSTGYSIIDVIVDTFTVLIPDEYYAYPIDSFTFDILNAKVEHVNQDLYVSPSGSDDNSGLTEESPLRTISWALAIIYSDSTNPHTIHLASGTYSQSNTGERFPLNCRSYISLQGEGDDLTVLDGEGLSGIFECINDSYFSIENMTIQNGNSYQGGGIYCEYSNPSISDIIVSENNATDGGGIYCRYSSMSLSNVTISRNISNSLGGGIYCYNSSPSFTNVTISENTASSGGGISCYSSNPSLSNVTISGNTASSGGGINCYNSSLSLENVTIIGNSANWSGGGIWCCEFSNPILENVTLENVTIIGNYASEYGGGIGCISSNPILTNVTISENIADYGGGIYCFDSNPSLSQVNIKKNNAECGGGIYCDHYSNLNFDPVNRCNIFLNFAISGNDLYSMGYSIIDVIVDTFTVLNPNECFAYPIDSFTFDILNFKIEQINQDLYVSPFGSDDNSGLTIESPLRTISWALTIIYSDSTNPHTIHLASGTYSQSNTGERFPLNCRSYISLQGEGEDLTILDGEGLRGILECINDCCFSIENMTLKSGNAHHGGGIHFCNSSPTLRNIILNGNISDYGGGIYCFDSSPTLENIILSGNIADYDGGGIYCYNSDLSLSNVTLLENTANSGGGICCVYSNPVLTNVTISENISSSSGGGIYCTGSAMVLTNITISRNISSSHGGGIYCKNSSQNLTNVTINGNTASMLGGGIYYSYSSPSLTNVIITGNNASMGAGIFCSRGSSDLRNVTITENTSDNHGGGINGIHSSQNLLNCILWNNVPHEIYGIIDTITVTYSDIKNGWEGIGNINADPLFADPENEDFHLTVNSPCIDTGIPDTTDLNLPFWDLDFKHRIWDGNGDGIAIIDMGCYEYGAGPLKIYPGDTNNDGIVDTLDILPIGQYFRKTGGLRETASLEWEPQILPINWANINYAYSDCNGDGEVNIADVHAICLNWGKTHEDTGFIITFTTEEIQNNIDTFQQIYNNLEDIGFEMVIKNYLANVFGFPSIPGNIIYLSQNYPNPFSTTTTISFYLAIPITSGKFTQLDSKHLTGQARIKIYNIKGQLVKKLSIDSNQFSIKWDGKDESGNQLSTGIYLYQLKAGNYKSDIKKMILIK